MSQTRICCPVCGHPQCWCQCKEKGIMYPLGTKAFAVDGGDACRVQLPDEAGKIKYEFTEKLKLYSTLVGNLYPSIVYNELTVLQDRYKDITGKDDLPYFSQPNESGKVS